MSDHKTIQLFGPIFRGFDPFSGVEALDEHWMSDQLADAGDVMLLVNSDGGDIVVAKAMMELIRRHKGHVTANVISIAASSASVLIMAADRVEMAPGSQLRIHEPFGGLVGTASEFREQADAIDHVKDTLIIPAYLERSNLSAEKISAMLAVGTGNKGTWIDANAAVEMGFADGISASPTIPVAALLRPAFAAGAPEGIVPMTPQDFRAKVTALRDDLRLQQIRQPLEHDIKMRHEFHNKEMDRISNLAK